MDKKIIIGLLLMFCISMAQVIAYNSKTHYLPIHGFTGDEMRVTDSFCVGDYEGLDVVILSTSDDSSKFIVGYQRGYPAMGSVAWETPTSIFDTVDIFTAENVKNQDSLVYTAVGDTDIVKALDATQLTGYVMMIRHIYPYRSPYGRFVVKGLTGNSVEPFSVIFNVVQPRYYRVNIGTSNQPDK